MAESGPLPRLATATSTELLRELRDPRNRTVWQRYVDRYRDVIVAMGRRAGLPAADAEDFAQQSLLAFSTAYREGHYDRDKGRLSAWLFGIVRRQLANFRRRSQRREVQAPADSDGGTGYIERAAAEDRWEEIWDEEWRAAILRRGLAEIAGEVDPATMAAFERFALRGEPADEVAADLGMTANAVYGAKRRLLQRLRDVLPLLEEVW